ncbi:MAG: hypothetical protein ACI835_000584 [Planctomycetota bacterium]|jgi:uncharacterized protein YyaL (SSP411 family)
MPPLVDRSVGWRDPMDWHEWSDQAFEEAKERRVPVLLFLHSSWCRFCRAMESESFGADAVQSQLSERAVCIRVNKDRRPDIDSRYRATGWPTVAWLDASAEVIVADGFLGPDALMSRLEEVEQAIPQAGERSGAKAPPQESPPVETEPAKVAEPTPRTRKRKHQTLTLDLVDDVIDMLIESADPTHGGWGQRHKFPHPEALQFCLVRWSETGDSRLLDVVLRTLRNMQAGEIYDSVEGGFYRYANEADWSGAHHEKMLDSNAQRSAACLEAYQALGDDSFRKTAEGVLDWMLATLLNPEISAFRGSQDAVPEYARLTTLEARRKLGAPPCDPTIFTNWNAMAVSTLLEAGSILNRDDYTQQGLRTLDFLTEMLWDRRHGMYHYWDGTFNLPGLLTDQAYTLRAMVDAAHFAGENSYLGTASELATLTIEHLQAEDGSFYDTHYDPSGRGSLRVRNNSILENSVLAEALLRLSTLTREPEFGVRAREALTAFLTDFKRYGHFTAGYGRAVDLLVHEPIQVIIVGPRDADLTRTLRRAALAPYVASRIVQTLDPTLDGALLESSGLPVATGPIARAYVQQGRESYAETSRPERLPALLSRAERSN